MGNNYSSEKGTSSFQCPVFGGKGHLAVISLIRFLAMLSIIACHFCQYFESEWAQWLNIGVQLFFIISGFLYGNQTISEPIPWLKKRFVKILVPYYLFLTVAVVGYLIVAPDVIPWKTVVTTYLVVETIGGIGHLWFVSYILFCYLLTPYLELIRNYIERKRLRGALVTLAIIIGAYSVIAVVTLAHFRPGMLFCYVLGYFTAVFTRRLGNGILLRCLTWSLLPTLLSNGLYIYLHYWKGLEMAGHLRHIVEFSHAFLGYSILLGMLLLFKGVRMNGLLSFSDRYSYPIYVVHQLFILSPLTLMAVTGCAVVNIGLALVVILVSGFALGRVDQKLTGVVQRLIG